MSATDLSRSVLGAACLLFLVSGAALASPAVLAQTQRPEVTDADVARAAKSQPVITDRDIEQAARKHRMPTDAELARVPVPSTPRIDALPQPRTQRRVDLGAVARGYEAMGAPTPSAAAIGYGPPKEAT